MNLWMKMNNLLRMDTKSNKDGIFPYLPSPIHPLSALLFFYLSSLHVYHHFLFITIEKSISIQYYFIVFKGVKMYKEWVGKVWYVIV